MTTPCSGLHFNFVIYEASGERVKGGLSCEGVNLQCGGRTGMETFYLWVGRKLKRVADETRKKFVETYVYNLREGEVRPHLSTTVVLKFNVFLSPVVRVVVIIVFLLWLSLGPESIFLKTKTLCQPKFVSI